MIEILTDALIDTLKLLPYLLVMFLVLELVEHKLKPERLTKIWAKRKIGPLVGGILGAAPQCGFSAMAAGLFTSRIITIGTVVAIFLATSDEMLPIMLGEQVEIGLILGIVGFKVLVGVVVGFLVDLARQKIKWRKGLNKEKRDEKLVEKIKKMCFSQHCGCKENGIILASLKHALKIGGFVLAANLIIGVIISGAGEEFLKTALEQKNILVYFVAALIGLIPNCASSVILTELYLSGLTSLGGLMAGLLPGSGVGILLLFRTNRNWRENVAILGIIYTVGVAVGAGIDLFCVF